MNQAGVALIVMIASAAFAALMIAQMLGLLLRRRENERHAILKRARENALIRDLMGIADGTIEPDAAEAYRSASSNDLLHAVSHLLQLVRGSERMRLLALAEKANVLAEPINQLSHGRPARRVDAMRLLEHFAVSNSISALETVLASDPVYEVRLEAAATLARMGAVPTPSRLIAALEMRRRPATRLHEALFRKAAANHVFELARLSRDDSLTAIRPLIVEAIGSSTDLAHSDLLFANAGDQDPEVRCAALRAARRIGNPVASKWATQLLLDANENVRIQAIQTCRSLGVREAIPILASLLRNSSFWVRTRARQALDELRPNQPLREGPGGPAQ
jgi:HEAT repeat protein